MRYWQKHKGSGDGIAPEHVVMVPESHRLPVDDEVVLDVLGLPTLWGLAAASWRRYFRFKLSTSDEPPI
jgi:hypothetical protein